MGEGYELREVCTLLPEDNIKASQFQMRILKEDAENATPRADSADFDPFKERQIDNPTTDCQTLTHLMKSTLGSGILSMPYAFKASGIVGGVLGGLCIAAISTHTSYILIDSAHKLYVKAHRTKMDYADVVETAFATGPRWLRKYTNFAKKFILIWLFSTYFGACVTDNILISINYGQVIRYYLNSAETSVNSTAIDAFSQDPNNYGLMRAIMGCLLVPLILFVWVPDLKYLSPVSMVANFLMATVIGITFYYLVQELKPVNELSHFQSITKAPQFISITLFAMANIGVVLPLENNMKTPQNFLGTCGVLNRGMFIITFVYILLGALGYARYGGEVQATITTNLPVTDIAAQIVKILIASTVLLTFGLQFYVCHEMVWTRVKKFFPNSPRLAEYTIRAFLVIVCVSIAIAMPMISPIVTLVGALGFSLLGIICPVLIELIVCWDVGYGRYNWKVYKNICLIIFGFCSMVFGTYFAIDEIVTEFRNHNRI